MKLKDLEKKVCDVTYSVFVDVGDGIEVIMMKPFNTEGYDWFAEHAKMKAYGDSEVACVMSSEALGGIVIHTTADGRKEIAG